MKQKSDMKLFQNDNFGTIRTVILEGQPWFVAKDVCDILGTTNPTMAMDGLEPFERTKFNLGRQGEANIIRGMCLCGIELVLNIYSKNDFKLEAVCSNDNGEQFWFELDKQFRNVDEFVQLIPDENNIY